MSGFIFKDLKKEKIENNRLKALELNRVKILEFKTKNKKIPEHLIIEKLRLEGISDAKFNKLYEKQKNRYKKIGMFFNMEILKELLKKNTPDYEIAHLMGYSEGYVKAMKRKLKKEKK